MASSKNWNESVDYFLSLATKHRVKMILIGGGAVNFHGYQRHSADVDFWIDTRKENLDNLLLALQEMGCQLNEFPKTVENQQQNISLKFSPADLDVELITRFDVNKTFDEAYANAEEFVLKGNKFIRYSILSQEDLITSKLKSGRPKDLLDIMELKRIQENK